MSVVDAWHRYDADERRLTAHVSERMLALAGVRPGSRVLDVATGRGEPAVRAATRAAPDGIVVGTDPSDEMLDFARAHAKAEDAGNLSLVVTDGEHLTGVPGQAFDVALCRWGFMFFKQPVEAMRAVRERLVPGGLLVAANWAEPARVPWWSMPRDVLSRHAPLPPVDPAAPGPCRYGHAADFHAGLAAAGFTLVHEEEIDTALVEATAPEGLVDWCLAFGMPPALNQQPKPIRDAWQRDLLVQAEHHHRDADGMYRLGGITHLVAARAA